MPNWGKDIVLPGNEDAEELTAAEAAEKMDQVLEMLKKEAQVDRFNLEQNYRIRYPEANSADNSLELRGLFQEDKQGALNASYEGTDEDKKTLYEMVLRGSLFVYPLGEAAPRQIQIGVDGKPKLSPPLDGSMEFDLRPPEKPGLLKSFLNTITFGYAFRDDFADYEHEKSNYERARKLEKGLPAERHRREGTAAEEREQIAAGKEAEKFQENINRLSEANRCLDTLMGPKAAHAEELLKQNVYTMEEMPLTPLEITGSLLTDHEFAAAALGACASREIGGRHKLMPGVPEDGKAAESYDFIFEGFFSVMPRPKSGHYGVVLDKGRQAVADALKAAGAGNYGPMGKLLADGLKMNNEQFCACRELNGNTALLGDFGGTMLGILEKNPEVMKAAREAGLTEEDLLHARGAANLAKVYKDSLEAQKEICQAAFEDRKIDDPKARIAAVAGAQVANQNMMSSWKAHDQAVEKDRDAVGEKLIKVTMEEDQMKKAHADPEAIAAKAAEAEKYRVMHSLFTSRGFPASDVQKQMGTLKEPVKESIQKQTNGIKELRELAEKTPEAVRAAVKAGSIGKALREAAAPKPQPAQGVRQPQPVNEKQGPQKSGPTV